MMILIDLRSAIFIKAKELHKEQVLEILGFYCNKSANQGPSKIKANILKLLSC